MPPDFDPRKLDFHPSSGPDPKAYAQPQADAATQNAKAIKKINAEKTSKTALKITQIALSIFGWVALGLLIFFAMNYLGWNHFVCPVPTDNFPAAFFASFAVIAFATTYYAGALR